MARVRSRVQTRRRHNKFLRMAKGYTGARSRLYRPARETVERAMAYSYRDRKVRKREFRRLWITRIGAMARRNGMSYSEFINGLRKNDVIIDRKMLAELAVKDENAFQELVKIARGGASAS
jgi:large subunit ribosomal protein L20